MPHTIKTVIPVSAHELQVRFRNGVTRRCDLKPLIESIDLYKHFLTDEDTFRRVRISEDGRSVIWNRYLDCGCETLWQNGKDVKSPFDSLLSCADAALLWQMDESTLRKAIGDGRLREGSDVMKFGKQWVVTVKAMTRLFGEQKKRL